jgi:predicted metal-dependent hydrolase
MRSFIHPDQADSNKITPRHMDFAFDDAIPTYWFDGDPFKTLVMTALSCTFPEGERFFIESVRHYQEHITDPELLAQVRGFIGQEAHHGKEHDHFNEFMERKGLPMKKIEGFVKQGLGYQKKILSPERQLAKTCALEHFTAMLAETMLKHPDILEGVDERLLPLWLWHSVEESEHKAVAFDVYQATVGDYGIRIREMMVTTVLFTFFTGLHTSQLYRAAGETRNWRSYLHGVDFLFGRKGVLRRSLPMYLSYYKRNFHPSDYDSRELRRAGLARLATLLKDTPELTKAA